MVECFLVPQIKDTSLLNVPVVLLEISNEVTHCLMKTEIDSPVTPS